MNPNTEMELLDRSSPPRKRGDDPQEHRVLQDNETTKRARRARRRELFDARMCLQDCGRRAQQDSNLCKRCDDALCAQYFARIGERRPG